MVGFAKTNHVGTARRNQYFNRTKSSFNDPYTSISFVANYRATAAKNGAQATLSADFNCWSRNN